MKIDNFPCDSLLFRLKFFTTRPTQKMVNIAVFDWRILKSKIFSWNFQFTHRRTSKEYFPLINLLCSSDSFVTIIDIVISSSHGVNRFNFLISLLIIAPTMKRRIWKVRIFFLDDIFLMPRPLRWSENQRADLDDEWEDWSIVWVLLNKFSSRCLFKCVGWEMTNFFVISFCCSSSFLCRINWNAVCGEQQQWQQCLSRIYAPFINNKYLYFSVEPSAERCSIRLNPLSHLVLLCWIDNKKGLRGVPRVFLHCCSLLPQSFDCLLV